MIDPRPLPTSTVSAASPTPAVTPCPGATAPTSEPAATEPVLCRHCGRTASNGISCEGMCVADSGY